MEFIRYLKEGLAASVQSLVANYGGEREAGSLEQMEGAVQGVIQATGKVLISAWLNAEEPKYAAASVGCECGEQAVYVRQRTAVAITLQGRVVYRRAYYVCGCGTGHSPLDRRLGIAPGQMSTAVKKVAALLGVQNAFAGSSSTLSAFVPLELSPNSIRAACQEVGEQVLTQESQTAARSRDLRQQTATQRHTICPRCVYGSLDGFQAPLLEGWHELKAGVFWTVDEHGRALRPRYFVDTLPADAFANLVWTKAWEMGADLAEQLVFIADGSVWIWRIVQALFPHAVQILDWYHATTYLADIAAEAFGEGTPEAQTWLADQKAFLYDGHPAAVMHACRDLRPKAPATADVARRYFANNRTRLRYAKFRALGFQIGSGVMESACKQIGLQRLKLSGARWRQEGARLMAKARAAFLSQEINFHPDSLPQLA